MVPQIGGSGGQATSFASLASASAIAARVDDREALHQSIEVTLGDDSDENDVFGGFYDDDLITQQSLPDQSVYMLDPPLSAAEKCRDFVLEAFEEPFALYIRISVILLIIMDGALFFFYLTGWQQRCRPRLDCEPRNTVYNIAVQVLTALLTYMSVASLPWRGSNFLHATGLWCCPRRNNAPGHDMHGLPTKNVWFHIPAFRRGVISGLMGLSCWLQFAHQASRVWYYSYELQALPPGSSWTSAFFALRMLTGSMGGAILGYELYAVRKRNPGKFGQSTMSKVLAMLRDMTRMALGKKPMPTSTLGQRSQNSCEIHRFPSTATDERTGVDDGKETYFLRIMRAVPSSDRTAELMDDAEIPTNGRNWIE